jgi:hypothetical protein
MPKPGGTEFRRRDRAWRIQAAGHRAFDPPVPPDPGRLPVPPRFWRLRLPCCAHPPAAHRRPANVIVFAAASLADALTEAAEAFEAGTATA